MCLATKLLSRRRLRIYLAFSFSLARANPRAWLVGDGDLPKGQGFETPTTFVLYSSIDLRTFLARTHGNAWILFSPFSKTKSAVHDLCTADFGRGDGDRTHDLSVPNAARYQLRYASNSLVYYSKCFFKCQTFFALFFNYFFK